MKVVQYFLGTLCKVFTLLILYLVVCAKINILNPSIETFYKQKNRFQVLYCISTILLISQFK